MLPQPIARQPPTERVIFRVLSRRHHTLSRCFRKRLSLYGVFFFCPFPLCTTFYTLYAKVTKHSPQPLSCGSRRLRVVDNEESASPKWDQSFAHPTARSANGETGCPPWHRQPACAPYLSTIIIFSFFCRLCTAGSYPFLSSLGEVRLLV